MADAYKYGHRRMLETLYPELSQVTAFIESRGGARLATDSDTVSDQLVFFGLQALIKQYLLGPVITKDKIDEAEHIVNQIVPGIFDRTGFEYILESHNGHLPVLIKAVPEGTVVKTRNVLMTVQSTDPKCPWIVPFIEDVLMHLWYTCTVCSLSFELKLLVARAFLEGSDNTDLTSPSITCAINDFGMRGASSMESAGYGGAAHLVNFDGTDNVLGSTYAKQYYGSSQVYGQSVPACEHTIIIIRGPLGELDAMRDLMNLYPEQPVSIVSDSYNVVDAVEKYWCDALKPAVLSRLGRAPVVIRLDSGDTLVTLDRVLGLLMEHYGYTTNSKGYKVLPPCIRVIQSDNVSYQTVKSIYEYLSKEKLAPENVLFGIGGALLQNITRDTYKFAMKTCHVILNTESLSVIKAPIVLTATGEYASSFKKSKGGLLKLVRKSDNVRDGYETVVIEPDTTNDDKDELVDIYRNGVLLQQWDFEEIRQRTASWLEIMCSLN